ncbi:MAG: polyphenol oxidase family protein [Planctomycetota bacterium]|jgi:YfiH family protein
MMRPVQKGAYHGFQFNAFVGHPHLRHVFGARGPEGLGNLAYSGGRDLKEAWQARSAWSEFLGVKARDWVVGGQVHGSTVRVVGDAERGRGAKAPEDVLPQCDGLITAERGLPLYVAVADCSGVLLTGPGILGVIHGGWRGLAGGILQVTVAKMVELGSPLETLTAGVAPCMAAASYEVGPEVGDAAPDVARYRGRGDRWQVDIGKWAADCLKEAGLAETNIHLSGMDTGSDEACFSHRRQGPGAGRNGLIAVLT